MDASTAEINQSTEITENLSTQTLVVDNDVKKASVASIRGTLGLVSQEEVEREQATNRLSILREIDQKLEQNIHATEQGEMRFIGQQLRSQYSTNPIDIPIDGSYQIDIDRKVNRPWYIKLDRQRLFGFLNKKGAAEDVKKIEILEHSVPWISYRNLKSDETIDNLSGITVEQFKKGCERSIELNMPLVDFERNTPEEIEGAKKNLIDLSQIPDEDWTDRRNVLNPFFFIHNNILQEDTNTRNEENEILIHSLASGEIPKETKNRMDYILKFDLMVSESPPSGTPYLRFCDTSPSVLFSPEQELTDDQLKYMLEITKEIIAKNKESGFNLNVQTMYENLDLLKQKGLLEVTLACMRAGGSEHSLERVLAGSNISEFIPNMPDENRGEIGEDDVDFLRLMFDSLKISPNIENVVNYVDLLKHKDSILEILSSQQISMNPESGLTLGPEPMNEVLLHPEKFGHEFVAHVTSNFKEYEHLEPRLVIRKDISDRIFETFKVNPLNKNSLFGIFPEYSEELMRDLPQPEKDFWKFFKNMNDLQKDFFISIGKKRFDETYHADGQALDIDRFSKDALLQTTLRPDLLRTWGSLSIVFSKIGLIESSELRGAAYLRISCALDNNSLMNRTEVEELGQLQEEFYRLYRFKDGIKPYENQALSILRKHLPFSTDESIRAQLKEKALDVGNIDLQNMDWIHQTIHNYVRADNPDYMRSLRDWVQNGDEDSKNRLIAISTFYPPESRPKSNFFTNENRETLAKNISTLNELVDLTEKYFEVNPDKITQIISKFGFGVAENDVLGRDIRDKSIELVQDIKNSRIAEFLINVPTAREQIKQSVWRGNFPDAGSVGLEQLDAIYSTLYEKILPVYTKGIEDKIIAGTLTHKDTVELLRVFSATVRSGIIEGDMPQVDANILRSIDSLTENDVAHPAQIRMLLLQLTLYQNQAQTRWNEFTGIARNEMVEMLTRSGVPEREALAKVTMTDLVNYEKSSYKFLIDPLFKMLKEQEELIDKLATQVEFPIPEVNLSVKGPDNKTVNAFLENFVRNNKIPPDFKSAAKFMENLESLQEFKADQLCGYIIPNYASDNTNEWGRYTKISSNGTRIEIYPFSVYGGNGVIVLKDGHIVENPIQVIKDTYKNNIVPAMLHALNLGE